MEMGSKKPEEETAEPPPPPRLQLFPTSHSHSVMKQLKQSPERSGMLSPPLQSPASVPFTWEEQPGKPRCFLSPVSSPHQLLDLPPRLLLMDSSYKFPSPTTVLEGPYAGGRSKFQSSSFRMNMMMVKQQGSLRKTESLDNRRRNDGDDNKGGFFTSWKVMFKSRDVFPSSVCCEEEDEVEVKKGLSGTKISSRSGSFSAATTKSHHLWATICEGLKQVVVVVPWRRKRRQSRKQSKEEKASFLLH